jgi:hypothetical protein
MAEVSSVVVTTVEGGEGHRCLLWISTDDGAGPRAH